jgi:hypothetical protein
MRWRDCPALHAQQLMSEMHFLTQDAAHSIAPQYRLEHDTFLMIIHIRNKA